MNISSGNLGSSGSKPFDPRSGSDIMNKLFALLDGSTPNPSDPIADISAQPQASTETPAAGETGFPKEKGIIV